MRTSPNLTGSEKYFFNGKFRIRLIGGTNPIYKVYFLGLKGISPENMAQNMVQTYLHLLDPGFPIDMI